MSKANIAMVMVTIYELILKLCFLNSKATNTNNAPKTPRGIVATNSGLAKKER